MERLRGSRWRHAAVLGLLLLIELALAVFFFAAEVLRFALPLFLAGALSTACGYIVLVRCWRSVTSDLARFALSIACAFAAFQTSLIGFALISGVLVGANPGGFTLIVLLGANIFFFPVWLLLGALAFGLMRALNAEPASPQRPPRATRRRLDG
jgi:hypothetical protein